MTSDPAAERIRLLIVDDDPRVRATVSALAEANGRFEVVGTAATAEEGIELAIALEPDVVSMDVDMPGMGGVAGTRVITKTLGIPVVVLTGSGFEREAAAAGAYAVVQKTDPAAIVPTLLAAVE